MFAVSKLVGVLLPHYVLQAGVDLVQPVERNEIVESDRHLLSRAGLHTLDGEISLRQMLSDLAAHPLIQAPVGLPCCPLNGGVVEERIRANLGVIQVVDVVPAVLQTFGLVLDLLADVVPGEEPCQIGEKQ